MSPQQACEAHSEHLPGAAADLPEPDLSDNARTVLTARYLKKDENGQVVETPRQLFQRVAGTIAAAEARYGASPDEVSEWKARFYRLMASRKFMPNSPTLMNAGREMGMLSACFVLPVRDSIDDIFDAIKHTALIQKAGGGTGFAFDELRPTGDYIRSSGGTTSGPISFWRAFSEATNAIQQGAFRRGANMGMMYIHHPDILKFLYAKQDLSQFTNYNISVKVPDAWMEGLRREPHAPHVVRNPRTGREYLLPRDVDIWKYDIRTLLPAEDVAEVVARREADAQGGERVVAVARLADGSERAVYTRQDVWDIIVHNAWATGEPGVVFIDRINATNPTPHIGRIEATNPCGEQPLLPYEACNLGSINLAVFVHREAGGRPRVDWDGLRQAVHLATRFLDNVVDVNNYPLPQIRAMCQGNRKIGLGVMGFADALFRLGVAYDSEEGVAWGERFMQFVNDEAHAASESLAGERGCFPNWAGSIWDTIHHRPMRNAAVTTVAPTGTISIIAGCSGGIEPVFSVVFQRNVLRERADRPLLEVNETFRQVALERGFYSEGLMDRIAREGTLAGCPDVPEDVRRVFVCAHDIAPEWHVRMQAAFQRHCDSSISKTINFPQHATPQDVETIYRLAWEMGCKGVTVYRDGCRDCQPMALKREGGQQAREAAEADTPRESTPKRPLQPRDLPEILSGLRIRQATPFGNMHVKITVDPRTEEELEVFAQLGKGGDVANSDLEAICRMISLWLRAGGGLKEVIRQLKDIGSSLQVPTREGRIMSLGDGLARALMKYLRAKEFFGLESLLLGRIDLSEIDRPHRCPTPPAEAAGQGQPAAASTGGNGNGSKRSRDGNGHSGAGQAVPEVRHGIADPGCEPAGRGGGEPARLDQAFVVKCPQCGSRLRLAEGCRSCPTCGWAQC